MESGGKDQFREPLQFLRYYFLSIVAAVSAIIVVFDKALTGGSIILQPILDFAAANRNTLSVIISALLLFAYLMQYQNHRIQRQIMARQVKLMRAGYTPILGVSSRSWGVEKEDNPIDIDQEEANRLFLMLSNSGNSTGRDLRIWTGIVYDASPELEFKYSSEEAPLRRTSDTAWWHSDQGGALAPTEDNKPIEFQVDPVINEVEQGLLKFRRESNINPLHSALEKLEEAGVKEVDIGFVLKYTSTTGAEEEIYLGAYEADLSNLKHDDMQIYRAQENKEEDVKSIQEKAT